MFSLCSPALADIMDIIEISSTNGYNFVAPEIVG